MFDFTKYNDMDMIYIVDTFYTTMMMSVKGSLGYFWVLKTRML